MATKSWATGSSGNWNVPGNWSGGLPGSTDDALIAVSGTYTVTLSDTETVNTATLNATGATLAIASGGQLIPLTDLVLDAGTLSLAGKITATQVIDNGGSLVVQGGTLSGVTWQGLLANTTAGGTLHIVNGISILNLAGTQSGELDITGQGSTVVADNATTLDGTGAQGDPGLLIDIGYSGANAFLSAPGTGALTIGAHATLQQVGSGVGTQAIFNGATLVNQGVMNFNGSNLVAYIQPTQFTNNGMLAVGNAETVNENGSFFTNSSTGVLTVTGSSAFNTDLYTITNNGVINVGLAGILQFNVNATGTGTINLSVQGTADVHNLGGTVDFLDSRGVLKLEAPGSFTGTIVGFQKASTGVAKDTIDLLNVANVTTLEYSGTTAGGTLTVMNGASTIASLNLLGDYTGTPAPFSFAGDGTTGFNITTTHVGCFVAGTRILTERGEIAVEDLSVGDRAVTLSGKGAVCKPVRWIGVSRIDLDRHPAPHTVSPIRVRAGAFGDGRPCRDLLLSPDHSVFVDGVLIPVHHLLNGATVQRENIRGVVAYYHVELDAHDVLVADGLPAESYLDTGNRGDFANGGGVRTLHPNFGANAWHERACAPLVTDGALLGSVRAQLAARLEEMGFAATEDAALACAADGVAITVERDGAHVWRCVVPAGTRSVRLQSRSFVPDERNPDAGDARRLGVPLLALSVDGVPVALDDAALASGLHPVEHGPDGAWRWTNGDARLELAPRPQARVLEITALALACPYWAAPNEALPALRRVA